MALSMIDQSPALVVIDLQRGFAGLPFAHSFAAVVERSARMAGGFRARGLPVVLVNNNGVAPGRREQDAVASVREPGWAELVDGLGSAADDLRVTKRSPGPFTGTGLERLLSERGVTQVVVAGVATGTGVEMTARQAYELGFNVAAAVDAMTDMSAEVHRNSVERIFPRIGETGRVDEIFRLIDAAG